MSTDLAQLSTLTLSELHKRLNSRGVSISLGGLSVLLNRGDIHAQLQVGGKGNRKEFPLWTVDVLADFIPTIQNLKGVSDEHAPELLRNFMKKESSDALMVRSESISAIQETVKPQDHARVQGLAMTDEIFTAAKAAEFLVCSISMLRKTIKPSFRLGKSSRGDRWKKSDLLSL